jgi:hypothetical protein
MTRRPKGRWPNLHVHEDHGGGAAVVTMTNASNSEQSSARPARVSIFGGLMLRLRTYFFAGILITAPISITIYLA